MKKFALTISFFIIINICVLYLFVNYIMDDKNSLIAENTRVSIEGKSRLNGRAFRFHGTDDISFDLNEYFDEHFMVRYDEYDQASFPISPRSAAELADLYFGSYSIPKEEFSMDVYYDTKLKCWAIAIKYADGIDMLGGSGVITMSQDAVVRRYYPPK